MSISKLVTRYGSYTVGFIFSIAALIAAIAIPAHATLLIVAAGIAALSDLQYTRENDPFITRLLGSLIAVVVLALAYPLQEQALLLIVIAAVIAVEVQYRTRNKLIEPDDESTGEV
ncbi:MAG: hypothetical protein ACRD3W_31145 [Terriglobales bacterium]